MQIDTLKQDTRCEFLHPVPQIARLLFEIIKANSGIADMEHYVRLSEAPMRFSPVTQSTSVFFDEANGQIFVAKEASCVVDVVTVSPQSTKKIVYELHFPQ